MTPEEKFLFDLQGFLVVKNVLSKEEMAVLNAVLDEKVAGKQHEWYTERVSNWGKPFQDLLDHPNLLPYIVELVHEKFRLDHDYCICMDKGNHRAHLHGGEGHESDHWYKVRNGQIRNGLTVFAYVLTDVPEGAGGFTCIPGTHKSQFLDGIPRDVLTQDSRPSYVLQPPVEAGSVVIFTEALVHGTRPWQADHQRRALLYKFSPGHSAWSQKYYSAAEYTDLTPQQRRILEPPSVGSRKDVVQSG